MPRLAVTLAGLSLVAAPVLGAQGASGRAIGVEPEPVQRTMPYSPYPGASVMIDPRGQPPRFPGQWRRAAPYGPPPVVVYVPVPVSYDGMEYVQRGRGYYAAGIQGSVTDATGRPLSIGFDAGPSRDAVPSYTPDLSGSPFVVIENGAMLVDLPNGERRRVPSCAAEAAARDPDGRARTVFYQPSEYGLVLRAGSAGRVQGTLVPGVAACYRLDGYGRVSLN